MSDSIVIVGAARGVGQELALSLSSRHGHRVFAGARKAEDLARLAAEDRCERTSHVRLTPIMMDATKAAQLETAAAVIAEAMARGAGELDPEAIAQSALETLKAENPGARCVDGEQRLSRRLSRQILAQVTPRAAVDQSE